ncbi:MAG: glycosyltransferase family 39 protein [Planctomycetales bacterium]|nr:glycosyltransferase family 39 protein [Planctomycetales bacterium]
MGPIPPDPPPAGDRATGRLLAAAFLAAAALRLPALAADPVVLTDETKYLGLARAAAAGHPEVLWKHDFHPLTATLLVPCVWLSPDAPEVPGRALAFLLGLAAVAAAYALGSALFPDRPRREAALGALLLALHPGAVEAGGRILSEGPFLPLVLGALAALARVAEGAGPRAASALGALAALAYLVRPEGIGPALVGAAAILLAPGRGAAARLRALGALVLPAALLAGPYMAAIGGFTRKKAVGALLGAGGLDPSHATAGETDPLRAVIVPWLGTDPGESSERPPALELLHEWTRALHPVFVALLVVALGVVVWRGGWRPRRGTAALLGWIGLTLLAHIWLLLSHGYLSGRHILPVAAALAPLAASLLSRAGELAASRGAAWGAATTAVPAVAVLALAAAGAHRAFGPWREGRGAREGLREAGLFLRARGPEGTGVASTSPRVAYYARGLPWLVGAGSWRSLVEGCRREGVRYVADERSKLLERVPDLPESPDPSDARVVFPLPGSPDERRRGGLVVLEIAR